MWPEVIFKGVINHMYFSLTDVMAVLKDMIIQVLTDPYGGRHRVLK